MASTSAMILQPCGHHDIRGIESKHALAMNTDRDEPRFSSASGGDIRSGSGH